MRRYAAAAVLFLMAIAYTEWCDHGETRWMERIGVWVAGYVFLWPAAGVGWYLRSLRERDP